MSIRIEEYTFDGPFTRIEDLEEKPGVYALLCLMSNQKHFLIDVGESENVRYAVEEHERQECWVRNCKGNIIAAALYTKELDQRGRKDIESFIRSREFAPCEDQDQQYNP